MGRLPRARWIAGRIDPRPQTVPASRRAKRRAGTDSCATRPAHALVDTYGMTRAYEVQRGAAGVVTRLPNVPSSTVSCRLCRRDIEYGR